MEASALLDAHVQLKRIYTSMNEAMDITQQLAEAVDRDDQVAIQMLVAMRQEPLDKLRRARKVLEQQRDLLEPEDARRLSEILNGGAAENDAEAPLTAQIGVNDRVLQQVQALDKVISLKLAREKSIYN